MFINLRPVKGFVIEILNIQGESLLSGHYFTFSRPSWDSKTWYLFDDDKVSGQNIDNP